MAVGPPRDAVVVLGDDHHGLGSLEERSDVHVVSGAQRTTGCPHDLRVAGSDLSESHPMSLSVRAFACAGFRLQPSEFF
jgi:hypothetical protein